MITRKFKMDLDVEVFFDDVYKINQANNKIIGVHVKGTCEGVEVFLYEGFCIVTSENEVRWVILELPKSIHQKIEKQYTAEQISEIFKALKVS